MKVFAIPFRKVIDRKVEFDQEMVQQQLLAHALEVDEGQIGHLDTRCHEQFGPIPLNKADQLLFRQLADRYDLG